MSALYRKINVENFDQIQEKLVPWVKRRHRWAMKFWNHVDQDQLFRDIPELLTAIEKAIGQQPLKTYMLAVPWAPEFVMRRKLGDYTLHRDLDVEPVRFNWPVLNSTSIETRLFISRTEPHKKLLSSGESYHAYKKTDCDQIDSFFLDQPALLHVHTIHGLYRATGPLPRYILSFNFEQDISHLL
jgi:hypothetical protein